MTNAAQRRPRSLHRSAGTTTGLPSASASSRPGRVEADDDPARRHRCERIAARRDVESWQAAACRPSAVTSKQFLVLPRQALGLGGRRRYPAATARRVHHRAVRVGAELAPALCQSGLDRNLVGARERKEHDLCLPAGRLGTRMLLPPAMKSVEPRHADDFNLLRRDDAAGQFEVALHLIVDEDLCGLRICRACPDRFHARVRGDARSQRSGFPSEGR